jgi:hypothetical protein
MEYWNNGKMGLNSHAPKGHHEPENETGHPHPFPPPSEGEGEGWFICVLNSNLAFSIREFFTHHSILPTFQHSSICSIIPIFQFGYGALL